MSAQAVLISTPRAIQLERILYATDFSPASERALPLLNLDRNVPFSPR